MSNEFETADVGSYLDLDKNTVDRHTELYLELVRIITGKLILKGNILLNQLIPDKARGTQDLDVSIFSEEVYMKLIKPELQKIGEEAVKKGIGVQYKLTDIQPDKSGQFVLWKKGKMRGSLEIVLDVDFSLIGKEHIMFSEYKINNEVIYGSSREKIVADKMSAIVTGKWKRRPKDLYDLYIIRQARWELDYKTIAELIIQQNGKEWTVDRFNQPFFLPENFMLIKEIWDNRFDLKDRNDVRIEKVEISEVIKEISVIYGYIHVALSNNII